MSVIVVLPNYSCFEMSEGSQSSAPFAKSAEAMTRQERIGVVDWLMDSPASSWSDVSKVLENAIPLLKDETKKRDKQTSESIGQDHSRSPDAASEASGDGEYASDGGPNIRSSKRPRTGRRRGTTTPSASTRVTPRSAPSRSASPCATSPTSAADDLNTTPERDDDAVLPDVGDIPTVHQEIVRDFFTMSAYLTPSTRSSLNGLVVSLARATTWREEHWRSIWEHDRSTVTTPTGASKGYATPTPSSSIEKLARLFDKIKRRTQYDEAVERLYLVLLRCEIVWENSNSPHAGSASRLAEKSGCRRLVTDHERRAARYTQIAGFLGNGALLSLGEGARRWDRLRKSELDVIRDFFRRKPNSSLVQQWLVSDDLVRRLTLMGMVRLGWRDEDAITTLNSVLPASTIPRRPDNPGPSVDESAPSPSQEVVTSVEPSSINMAPFDGMAPYGPIYDTHAALFLEPSNPEMGLVELQSFDGGRLT